MNKLRLLDLYCGAGGAAYGYMLSGFHVTGVDIKPQPRYPFTFVQADALEYLAAHGHEFDVIHASPECQGYSAVARMPWVHTRQQLIPYVRVALEATSKPYVIENVPGSQKHLRPSVILCGLSFGLHVLRHRHFETSHLLFGPPECPGHRGIRIGENGYVCVAGHGDSGRGRIPRDHRNKASWQHAMSIDWMTMEEMAQAIPPAYTEWIGRQLLRYLHS